MTGNNRPPNPRQLIPRLLIAAEGEALSTREIVGACRLMGITENSARVALVRLAGSGMIESAEGGRHRLGPEAASLAADVARWRAGEARTRDWQGGWIAVHSGPLGRTDRSALRVRDRALDLLGMMELDRGFYVRPDNLAGGVEEVRERLQKLGLEAEASVFVASQFDGPREQRARKLWDGPGLSRRYRDLERRLREWMQHAERLELEAAARESYLLGDRAISLLVFDPMLPSPLVDVAARARFIETVLRFDRFGHDIWRRLAVLLAAPTPGSRDARPSRSH